MVQALRAIGYSCEAIAEGTGVGGRRYVGRLSDGAYDRLFVRTAERIESFYWERHDKPVLTGAGNKKAMTHACGHGFAAPASWDDITDPYETPKGLRKK